jgi:hypothetical protein
VSTALSDELLSQLMAVGQVDVLVGLPTLNHADNVAAVVRAAHVAFNRELARQRTVLVNFDGGSSDGTPEIVRDASIVERETLLASHSLRTHHRISAPYHGVPGKAAALRAVFAAADLLQAKAVVVLDPELASVTPESVAALARPALAGDADYVSPAYSRHPADGPLVTQVVRPLFRAAYGVALSEPIAGEFGCSGRFAARCLEERAWASEDLRLAIDLWLSGVAASCAVRIVEAALGPRRLSARARPGVAELVPQVLEALFTCLRLQESEWTAGASHSELVRATSPPVDDPVGFGDRAGYADRFREGLSALAPILERALSAGTLAGLRAALASDGSLHVPDPLWGAVVRELAAAHRHGVVSRDHLLGAAVPLYLGRVASVVPELAGLGVAEAEQRLEALCVEFESSRGELIALWTGMRGE